MEIVRSMNEPFNGIDVARIDWRSEAIREILERLYSPDVELTTSESGIGSGPSRFYKGWDGLISYLQEWFEPFSEYRMDALDYIDAGDRVLVPIRARGIGSGSGVQVEIELTIASSFATGRSRASMSTTLPSRRAKPSQIPAKSQVPLWTAMKRGPLGDTLRLSPRSELKGGPTSMLHAGLDLSRKKVDVCLLSETGEHLDQLAAPPDADSLRRLARRIEEVHHQPVCAVIESMTGARMVHDTLEAAGWAVEIADAQKVKGLAPLACKTDKIDSQVLATLSQRDLVPAIWLPDPRVREERELARFRLHLVKHRSMLKHRVHSSLVNFGRPCPVSDLFGVEGRKLLERLEVPEPWRGNITASVLLIDDLEGQIAEANRRLKQGHADHPYVPLLMSAPGIGWVLAFTIAAEIGEI